MRSFRESNSELIDFSPRETKIGGAELGCGACCAANFFRGELGYWRALRALRSGYLGGSARQREDGTPEAGCDTINSRSSWLPAKFDARHARSRQGFDVRVCDRRVPQSPNGLRGSRSGLGKSLYLLVLVRYRHGTRRAFIFARCSAQEI